MITWNVSPAIFTVGSFELRYYSLAFMLSFLVGYYIFVKIYQNENRPVSDIEDLFVYMFLGTILGARIGHCLFYAPGHYLANPLEILKIWEGGLASHGAALGILLALYLYSNRKKHQDFLWIVDRMVIVVAMSGCFIRLGNLFNSEIVGAPTGADWGFLFTRYERNPVPRHPSQIYEAAAYLGVFIYLLLRYNKQKEKTDQGSLFGRFLIGVFGFRFFVEFFKENQEAWEATIPLNMGQWLSIPLVILGIYLVMQAPKLGPLAMPEKKAEGKGQKEKGKGQKKKRKA